LLFLVFDLHEMKVALFVPCYVDQFYPGVAIASLQLLKKFGFRAEVPMNQTCCGQPMANSGFEHLCHDSNENFIRNFEGYDYIVSPSGSCVLHVKDHLHSEARAGVADEIRTRVFELTEFMTDIVKAEKLEATFPFKVGLHESCHGQRGLHLSQMSELVAPPFSKPVTLLRMVREMELISLARKDECCGFGGTFSVFEEAVSVKMGQDRIDDHLQQKVDYITGTDMSCLMHLEGILRRQKSGIRVIHVAEILNAQ
jgi:L-lactate dehydrogenase complex protein LldE